MVVVIADDISGAAELAGMAHARGWSAEIQTTFDPGTGAELIALDSNTRCMSPEDAVARVRKLSRRIVDARPDWIYKKTDSVLRGHVRLEITTLLEQTGWARALLIPANPRRERVIRGGEYFVGEIPLHKTVFGTDPVHPATSCRVRELLGREPGAEIHLLGAHGELPAGGIGVPDIQSSVDLQVRARSLDAATLPAGAAEFFDALLSERRPKLAPPEPVSSSQSCGPTLVVCGSAAAWPIRSKEANGRGVATFCLPERVWEKEAAAVAEMLKPLARAIDVALAERGCGMLAIGDLQLPAHVPPQELVRHLATTVRLVLSGGTVGRLLLEGGATAQAVLEEMHWSRLEVRGHFAPDLAILTDVRQSRPHCAIKPGSYRWPETIW